MNNKELFEAIDMLEKEKNIPAEYMFSQIQKAIEIAFGKNYGNDNVKFVIDRESKSFEAYLQKEVVETLGEKDSPNSKITLEKAREINPGVEIGDFVGFKVDTKTLGRIGVNAARNVIRQGINESEKGQLMMEFQSKIGELVTATVERIDPKTGNATVRIGKSTANLLAGEQVNGEVLTEGELIKVYISDVQKKEKGTPKVLISRTHPEFVKRLFETEVPEIYDGTVEIKSVSREAGSRTKIAVISRDKQVDAIGACIGTKGARVGTIVNELNGEKIDIIEYDEDPKKFIAAALSPASVIKVQIATDGSKTCRVTVPDSQLSLAIGNKGQNARLAARLTGWKIDIRPESGFFGEDEDDGLFSDEVVTLNENKDTDGFLDESDSFDEDVSEEADEAFEEEDFSEAEEDMPEAEDIKEETKEEIKEEVKEEIKEEKKEAVKKDTAKKVKAEKKKIEISDDILDAILGIDSGDKYDF